MYLLALSFGLLIQTTIIKDEVGTPITADETIVEPLKSEVPQSLESRHVETKPRQHGKPEHKKPTKQDPNRKKSK
jgi:hypothetical protein